MKPAGLSGSGGDRARECPPAYALPADPRTSTVYADRGTAKHAFLADIASDVDPAEALSRVAPEYRDDCAKIDLAKVPHGDAEHAYIYHVERDTVRILGRISHREYPKMDAAEIPATIDLVYQDGDTFAVRDWKTGHGEITPARESMQLALGALMVARSAALDTIHVEMARVTDDGDIFVDRHTLDAMDLDAWAAEWRETHARVMDAREALARGPLTRDNVAPGGHCKYCPARGSCPEYATTGNELVAAPPSDWLARFETAIADDDGAAEWWAKIERAEEIVSTMRGLLESRAAARPFVLADGSTVREIVTRRESVKDADAVYRALADLYGADVANAACETVRKTTKGAIEKAVKKGGGDVKTTLRVLQERGGIGVSESKKVEAIRARKEVA